MGIGYEAPFDYYGRDVSLKHLESNADVPAGSDVPAKRLYESIYNSFKIYAADYVTATDGTGIVHTAPEFGEDDFATGKKYDLYQTNALNEE